MNTEPNTTPRVAGVIVTCDHETFYRAVGLIAHQGQPSPTTDPDAAYRWNGFVNPLFDRDTAERVCADFTATGDGDTYTMQSDGSIVIDVSAHYPDASDDPITTDTPREDGTYGTWTFGYVWQAVDAVGHDLASATRHPAVAGGSVMHSVTCTCGWSMLELSDADATAAMAAHLIDARAAADEWLAQTDAAIAALVPGTRVRLVQPVDRYPYFVAPVGAVGTVVDSGDRDVFAVRLDAPLAGAEGWANTVHWYLESGDLPTRDLTVVA